MWGEGSHADGCGRDGEGPCGVIGGGCDHSGLQHY